VKLDYPLPTHTNTHQKIDRTNPDAVDSKVGCAKAVLVRRAWARVAIATRIKRAGEVADARAQRVAITAAGAP